MMDSKSGGPAWQGDLVPTLRLYLEADLNRRKVATQLHVHPNTVDYRIRRVAVLTGLDTTAHRDLLTLSAALAAHDAATATPHRDGAGVPEQAPTVPQL
ncbi:helix-turn-helix domain-containing protein [Actinoplanes utahensis]|uniref:PucR C-terminal helix-turn-helix domain-containing protein n=1 Tax=Actinoplanes utahensis TaxID=1869 RepID=A0A0A6UML7_ACTUT|nr:helix-turn-helix domain-containing protein [Actinoplanes utahensis]KHD75574.1 hypothetical protein MB27_22470 [Actinoplanes utahensis]GIF32390.1 hypothetical protein Aut01nite_53760 [Actinoplanes utahensis]